MHAPPEIPSVDVAARIDNGSTLVVEAKDVDPYDVVLNHPCRQQQIGQLMWTTEYRGQRRTIKALEAQLLIGKFQKPQIKSDGTTVTPRVLYREKDSTYRRATYQDVIKNVASKRSKPKPISASRDIFEYTSPSNKSPVPMASLSNKNSSGTTNDYTTASLEPSSYAVRNMTEILNEKDVTCFDAVINHTRRQDKYGQLEWSTDFRRERRTIKQPDAQKLIEQFEVEREVNGQMISPKVLYIVNDGAYRRATAAEVMTNVGSKRSTNKNQRRATRDLEGLKSLEHEIAFIPSLNRANSRDPHHASTKKASRDATRSSPNSRNSSTLETRKQLDLDPNVQSQQISWDHTNGATTTDNGIDQDLLGAVLAQSRGQRKLKPRKKRHAHQTKESDKPDDTDKPAVPYRPRQSTQTTAGSGEVNVSIDTERCRKKIRSKRSGRRRTRLGGVQSSDSDQSESTQTTAGSGEVNVSNDTERCGKKFRSKRSRKRRTRLGGIRSSDSDVDENDEEMQMQPIKLKTEGFVVSRSNSTESLEASSFPPREAIIMPGAAANQGAEAIDVESDASLANRRPTAEDPDDKGSHPPDWMSSSRQALQHEYSNNKIDNRILAFCKTSFTRLVMLTVLGMLASLTWWLT